MPNESQHLTEASHGQQTTVLCICYLPYLAQYSRGQLGALKELDCNFARYDTEFLCICLLKEILEHTFLFRRQVEYGLIYVRLAVVTVVLWVCMCERT